MKRKSPGPALVGVPLHGLGIVRRDDHQVQAADPVGDRLELDLSRLGHGAGVEGADLGVVGVGGADEPGGVLGLGDVDRPGQHPVPIEPGPVLAEVLPDRADQQRVEAERRQPEADVGRDAAALDLQVLDQEAERDLVQVLDHQRLGEATREGHQVVHRDGAGDGDLHAGKPNG